VELENAVRAARPDIIWSASARPSRNASWLNTSPDWRHAHVRVGAAFDFHSGRVSSAPLDATLGLEWLYRLCHEPRRLARRISSTIPSSFGRLLGQRLGWQNIHLKVCRTVESDALSRFPSLHL